MINFDTVPELVTIQELAARLDTSIRHIRRLVDERRIPYLKVGGLIRFSPVEIAAWLDDSRPPFSRPGATPWITPAS